MKILYDNIIFSLQRGGGISRYWVELIKYMYGTEVSARFLVHGGWQENILAGELEFSPGSLRRESVIPVGVLRYLPIRSVMDDVRICHSSYYRYSSSKSVLNITTVHDFTYERFSSGIAKRVHVAQKQASIAASDGIICVSESTRRDLLRYCPDVDVDRICVIHHGIGEEFISSADADTRPSIFDLRLIEEEFVIYVGGRASYKRFSVAIEAATHSGCRLVSVGGGKMEVHFERRLNAMLPNRWHHFPSISTPSLKMLYRKAHCLVYPSLYEGFGLPVLEAMACGCPVIAFASSSIPEVAGGAAVLVESPCSHGFTRGIVALRDSGFRSTMVGRFAENLSRFSWQRAGMETLKFYRYIDKLGKRMRGTPAHRAACSS